MQPHKAPMPIKPEPRRCYEDDIKGVLVLCLIPIWLIFMIIMTIEKLN